MHHDRMKEIGKVAVPREGTPEWHILQKHIKKNENNPFVKEYTKKIFNEAVATCEVQELNGAGLPADTLLREYNTEYNNRVFNHSLHQLPSSFNVVEAFNTFIPPSATFIINNEIDCIFSFDDFLDFVTSEDCPSDLSNLNEFVEDGTIYSFNSVDDPSNSLFSTTADEEFGILSISLVKHKNEVSVAMLAGQKCDLNEKTKSLDIDMSKAQCFNGINPDESLKVEAVPLLPNSNLWRTIVLVRFDLESSTIDARYIYQDAGRSFTGFSDDMDCYLDHDGNFHSEELEDAFKKQNTKIEEYNPLFELCKTALFLPVFRNEYEDTISIERHPTEFGQKRNKPSFKKTNKLAKIDLKIAFRNVESIQPINRNSPSRREFLAPELRVETSGYWKKLPFQSKGEDKNNSPIQGRTWVNKTLEWKETPNKPISVKVVSNSSNTNNEGFIYVMRSAVHDKNVFKVGLTRRTPEERSKELSRSTSSPDHFHVMQEWDVNDCVLAEKLIHEKLSDFRVNPKREYFKAPYKEIFKVIDEVIDSLEIDSYQVV
ncbi:GIY-YIG nuclease family protein [Pseudoalteromonas sp. S1727]|uniref:GIY-YIG nuclease family protein n=1 Tax=Pseudoalteromonas sp. S1727 TaxID=2066514 RepID=UPI001485C4F9|nr:GIY-YIG nuclease family protein [Pseudoalteromonas sp. S1727]